MMLSCKHPLSASLLMIGLSEYQVVLCWTKSNTVHAGGLFLANHLDHNFTTLDIHQEG